MCMFSIPDRKRSIPLPSIHLSLGDRVPAEIQLPVESPVGHIWARHVLKRLIADDIDDGAHHRCPGRVAEGKTIRKNI